MHGTVRQTMSSPLTLTAIDAASVLTEAYTADYSPGRLGLRSYLTVTPVTKFSSLNAAKFATTLVLC